MRLQLLLLFAFSRNDQALVILLSQLGEEDVHSLQSHTTVTEIEAQREKGVGGPQMQVDWVIGGSHHLVE